MSLYDHEMLNLAGAEPQGRRLTEMAEAMSDMFAICDGSGRLRYLNQAGRRLLGIPPDEDLTDTTLRDFQPGGTAPQLPTPGIPGKDIPKIRPTSTILQHRDGQCIPASVVMLPNNEGDGTEPLFCLIVGVGGSTTNPSDPLELFKRALDFNTAPIVIIDFLQPNHPVIYANRAFEDVTGYSSQETLGRNATFLLGTNQDQPELGHIREALRAQHAGHAILRNYCKDGREFWNELSVSPIRDEHGQVTHFIGVLSDVTTRREAEQRLEFLATHDELCGIPKRTLLVERVRQAMKPSDDRKNALSILYVGIDRLKSLNQSLGYAAGDAVLRETANRLKASLGAEDMVARIGSDEFAIICPGLRESRDIAAFVKQLQDRFATPFSVSATPQFVSMCIGVSVFPEDGEDPELLVQNAAISMHRAKTEGRNSVRFFAPDMDVVASRYRQLEHDLRLAFERGELCLFYQPQMDLASGRVTGVESLLRWQHPHMGWISPTEFVPAAEESGLIVPLGEWVLREACGQAATWQKRGYPPITVAVNLSAHQFRQPDLVGTIRAILSETELDPRHLELELTETSLMSNTEEVSNALFMLRELGLQLSVDDFGTGYSSLSYLRRFPVTKVKIDRSFITNVTTQPEDAAVTRAIISMGHGLKLKVIAEGVESEAQKAFLLRHGCDAIQGYLLSPPVPPEQCAEILRKHADKRTQTMTAPDQQPALLLVDDEPSLLRALWRTLRLDGYRILMANSAREALDMLASEEVGVIVSDQRMPEMTGVEFLRRVKELYPKTIRIVLSGYTELDSVTSAINEGAIYKFLTKPWEDQQLRENISEAFGRFRMEQENFRLTDELRHANEALSRLNKSLEQQVAEKMLEVAHNIGMLQVSQEILESLPIGIIGVDEYGMIAFSNRQADALFKGGLLGDSASQRLPDVIQGALQNPPPLGAQPVEGGRARLDDGNEYQMWLHAMGESSRSKGVVIVLLPMAFQ